MCKKYAVAFYEFITLKEKCFSILYNTEINPNTVSTNDSLPCYVCMFAVDGIGYYAKNFSRAVVRFSTGMICHHLPPHLRNDCFQMVEKFAHIMSELIVELTSSRKVCTIIHLCHKRNNSQISSLNDVQNQLESETLLGKNSLAINQRGGLKYVICKKIVSFAEHLLVLPVTKNDIRLALNLACQILNFNCDIIIRHVDQIMDLISRAFTPAQICHTICRCTAHVKQFKPNSESTSVTLIEPQAFPNCNLCHFIAITVRAHLKPPVTKAQLDRLLHQVCNKMPKQRANCQRFLQSHYAPLLHTLMNPATRYVVCSTIHVCPPPEPSHTCTLCQLGVTVFKTVVRNQLIAQWMHVGLLKGCNLLPKLMTGFCQHITNSMWPSIFRFVANLNERATCHSVSLCATPSFVTSVNYQLEQNPCLTCRSGVNALKQLIAVPVNEQKIRQGVYKMCEKLHQPFSVICHMQVDLNWNNAINYLKNISPNNLCHIAELCSTLNYNGTALL